VTRDGEEAGKTGAADGDAVTAPALDFARLVEEDADPLVVYDAGLRFLYVNAAAAAHFGVPRADVLGRPLPQVFPGVVGQPVEALFRRVLESRHPETLTIKGVLNPDQWFEVRCTPHGEGGLLVHYRDATDEVRADRARRDAEERLAMVARGTRLGVWDYDIAAGRETWSPEQEALFGLPPGGYDGRVETFYSLVHPDDREAVARVVSDALSPEGGEEYESEFRVVRADTGAVRWLYGRGQVTRDPATRRAVRLTGINLDVTARKRAEESDRFLVDLDTRTRALLDPERVIAETVRAVGAFLSLSRYLFSDIDLGAGICTIHRDWCAEGVPSMAGTWPLEPWGAGVLADLAAGRTVVSRDHAEDARAAGDDPAIYERSSVRASVGVPLFRDGAWVGVFSAQMCGAPRDWTDGEVELLEEVARRMWLTLENARLYRTAERERDRFRALVEASSQMVWRTGPDGMIVDMPEWRFFTGQTEEEVRGYGWVEAIHPDDRERVRKTWLDAYNRSRHYACEYRVRGRDGTYRWFAARGVPRFDPRTGDLREYIGTWASIDAEKRLEEERAAAAEKQARIAETLQRSMLMAPPDAAFPGLSFAPFYEAAWDEAQVGGDFHDAFALSDGRVALVVGDVTGKGLEAAAYTAEAKFALRAFLREGASPPDALTRLNRFLLDGQTLDGRSAGSFVCCTVAVLDPRTGAGVSANAGGEPPLVVRSADASAEPVPARGVLLAADPGAAYEGHAFCLEPGDLLVLTTDGVTEARSPSDRRAFFGSEGLASAAAEAAARNPTSPVAEVGAAILERARAFGGGRFSDDVCLLLARREGTGAQ
jgi:PAS domain S-box-containing protein